jgi:septin family protein
MDDCPYTPKLLDIVVPNVKESLDNLKCIFLVMEYIPNSLKETMENEVITTRQDYLI